MAESTPPWEGRLDDRFEYFREVGTGASSRVYCAYDHQEDRQVAIKVLLDLEGHQRFLREVALQESLNAPSVCRCFSHGQLPSGQHYSVLEWLEGKDLGDWFKGHALTLDQAADIILGAAKGLTQLHEANIVHRDIKPANIYICDEDGPKQPKVLDLGVAIRGGSVRGELESGLVGTPSYMCPELASMEAVSITPAVDVYSLCAVYYELLTGRRPHEQGHLPMLLTNILHEPIAAPSMFNREVPPALDALIMHGLAREPENRIGDGAALANALERLMKSGYQETSKPSPEKIDLGKDLPPTPKEPRTVAVLLMKSGSKEMARLSEAGGNEEIGQLIIQFGGTLYTQRDGVMVAIFGEEKTLGDEANRALKAGLRTQRQFYLSAAVVLGKFGGEYSLAPSVELAIRLLQQPGTTEGIRVDGNTVRRAHTEFNVVRKKGYSVVPGTMEWHERKEQDLVGRDLEKKMLKNFLQCISQEARPHVMLIVGEDGMGKSSLCTWFYRKAGEEGFHLYPAVAHSEMTEKPYAVMERLLASRAGIAEDLHPHIREAMVERFAARHVNHAQALSFILGQEEVVNSLDEEAMRWNIWEAVSDVAEADLASGPLLWMVDDFHQADVMSTNLLSWLLASARGGLGLIATTTPDHVDVLKNRLPQDVQTFVHTLNPLSRTDARVLVKRNMPDPDTSEVRAIVNRADGNPLFLEELARLYRHGTSERAVTRNIQITAQMALDRISANAGRVARAASVLGERGTIAALLHMLPEINVEQVRTELEESGIWRPYPSGHERQKSGWRFKHTLTRDAVYHLLPKESRLSAHDAAARYFDEETEEGARKAARHFLAAGNKEEAARCLLTMARSAHAAADIETTLHLVQKVQKMGVAGIYKQEVLYLRAAAHTWMGRLVLALEDVNELLAEEDGDPSLRARAACLGCLQVRRLGDRSHASEMAETAVAAGRASGNPVLLAKCHFHAAIMHYDSGNEEGIAQCLKALQEVDTDDDRVVCYQAELEHMLAVTGQKFEEAVEKGKLALQYNRQLNNYPRLGANVGNVGICLRHLGRFRESLSFTTMARTIYKRQRNRLQRYDAAMDEGRTYGMLARYDEALASLDEAMGGFVKAGEVHRTHVAELLKARVLAARNENNDMELARKYIKKHIKEGQGILLHAFEAHLAAMDVYQRSGEGSRAAMIASNCLDLLDTHGTNNEFASEALAFAAICLEDVGHPRAAEATFRASERLKRMLANCQESASRHGLTYQIRAHRIFIERHPLD